MTTVDYQILQAEYNKLKEDIKKLYAAKETACLLALEFGYKQCEKGENIQAAFLNYNEILYPKKQNK